MPWEMHLRPEAAVKELEGAALDALQDTYQLDIMPEAKALVPVETGKLKESLAFEVKDTEKGPEGKMFSQTGYGAYVEYGIKGKGGPGKKGGQRHHMAAQPYMLPAFIHGIKNYAIRVHNKLHDISLSAAQKEMKERNLG